MKVCNLRLSLKSIHFWDGVFAVHENKVLQLMLELAWKGLVKMTLFHKLKIVQTLLKKGMDLIKFELHGLQIIRIKKKVWWDWHYSFLLFRPHENGHFWPFLPIQSQGIRQTTTLLFILNVFGVATIWCKKWLLYIKLSIWNYFLKFLFWPFSRF